MASTSVQPLPVTTSTTTPTSASTSTTSSTAVDMSRRRPAVTYGSSQNAKRSSGAVTSPGKDQRMKFLNLHHSDGTEVWQDGGVNGPTPEMLDSTPDENGAQCYMRPVGRFEKKEVEWLKQLAEGVVKDLIKKDKELEKDWQEGTKFFFHRLPVGYRLYEQIRVPGNSGGKPRRDTYLYGHPKGPRKRFRSPGDFLVHVKWLSTDATKNPANCTCNACKGGAPPTAVSPPAIQTVPAIVPASIPSSSNQAASTPTAVARKQAVPVTRRSASAANPLVQLPVQPSVASFPPPPTQPAVPENILLTSKTHRERYQELQFPGLAIYRLGEQVWFQTGPHWAIGVVIEVPAPSTSNYKIQPLQSPLICEQTPPQNEIPALQLRPWVAWSTPPVTNRNLDSENTIDYENLPWQQESRSTSIEVDASILKSRDVDISYTLIEKLTNQNHYAGVYHGAERFWIGDAIRLKTASNPQLATGREIMVVTSIQGPPPNASVGGRSGNTGVTITGDVFRLTTNPQDIPNPPGLPIAVQADLSARFRFSAPNPDSPYWSYTQIARNLPVKLEDVKGRWYPGFSLYQIVHGVHKFRELAQTASINHQDWDDTGSKMNEMGTGGGGAVLGYRRYEHRHQAFAKAIPSRIVFTPLLAQDGTTIEGNMQMLGLHPTPSGPDINAHTMNTVSEPIDLTADGNEGMEFIADPADEEFMKRMGEDAVSFLDNEGDFYGAL